MSLLTSAVTIRPASRSDLPRLYQLWTELMDEHQPYHPVFGYHRRAEVELKRGLLERLREPYTRFFVAENEQGLVGLLVAMYQVGNPGMHFSRRGYIAETLVRPPFRRAGLGRRLFETARQWLHEQGADHLELQVATANPGAMQFWAALGFAPSTYHLVLPLASPGPYPSR